MPSSIGGEPNNQRSLGVLSTRTTRYFCLPLAGEALGVRSRPRKGWKAIGALQRHGLLGQGLHVQEDLVIILLPPGASNHRVCVAIRSPRGVEGIPTPDGNSTAQGQPERTDRVLNSMIHYLAMALGQRRAPSHPRRAAAHAVVVARLANRHSRLIDGDVPLESLTRGACK